MTEEGRSIVQFHPNAAPGFDVLRYGFMAATACNYTSYRRRVLLREWCNCGAIHDPKPRVQNDRTLSHKKPIEVAAIGSYQCRVGS